MIGKQQDTYLRNLYREKKQLFFFLRKLFFIVVHISAAGCLCRQKSSDRPLTAEGDVEQVPASFLHSPKKSKGTAAKELSIAFF
jgi:hypothetical protein